MKHTINLFALLFITTLFFSCSGGGNEADNTDGEAEDTTTEEVSNDPMKNKGIGPISNIELAYVNDAMAAEGMALFESKCSACHKTDKRFVGPALAGIVERRSPEWIMNMILNPEQMVAEDPIAMELFAEYLSPMANQSLTEDEARKILEYFRTL